MADIKDLAVAYWRMNRWLENTDIERKMAAKSALRAIKRYLDELGIEARDITGSQFDPGLAVSVVNNESDETDEDKLLIIEMVRPIILEKGAVIEFGQVIIGDKLREKKVEDEEKTNISEPIQKDIDENTVPDINVFQEKDSLKKNNNIIQWILYVLIVGLFVCNTVYMHTQFLRLQIENEKLQEMVLNDVQENGDPSEQSYDSGDSDELQKKIESLEGKIDEMMAAQTQNEENNETDEVQENYICYIVQTGDTITKICSRFKMNYTEILDEIVSLNDLEDVNEIKAGQILRLPAKGE